MFILVVIAGVVFSVLVFAPALLAVLFGYGVLAMFGWGDPTGVLAAIVLTVVWRVFIRLPIAPAEAVRESQEMFVGVFGLLWEAPLEMLGDALRRVLSRGRYVKVIAGTSYLLVQPSTVEAGRVRFKFCNQHDLKPSCTAEGILVSIMRTDLPYRALPLDLRRVAGRPADATPVWDTHIEYQKTMACSLRLTPGRYVIGCQRANPKEDDELDHYLRMRASVRVEAASSKPAS
jgi:hypothetical protein